MAAETAEPETKDWHDVETALRELQGSIGRLSAEEESPAAPPSKEPKRLPSIFAASSDSDIRMLSRLYTPNIFAWGAYSQEGVEDDVDDLRLRVAFRLRSREEALRAKDLEAIRQLQRQEMREADEFMQAFDAEQWMQNQGPLPPTPAPGAGKAAPKPPRLRSQAGPLPREVMVEPRQVVPPSSGWPRRPPPPPPPPPSWSPALADIISVSSPVLRPRI
mmetsp:Transcript_43825/g.90460  ORF Transcript_43825/g.90460 Transcript_43825/m.90460 type:complete len:219 (-) Transcript_43825:89-745(-)